MKNFRDLKVWEKAHALALESYKVTNDFPRAEMFGLISQIRRVAVSIAANNRGLWEARKRGISEVSEYRDWFGK